MKKKSRNFKLADWRRGFHVVSRGVMSKWPRLTTRGGRGDKFFENLTTWATWYMDVTPLSFFPTVIPRPFWYQCHATDLLFHKRKVFTIILHDARSLIVICLFGFSHVRSTLGWLHPVFPYVYSSLRFTLIRVGIGWRTEGMS